MADLERDLERLLAGDQNVGLAPVIGPRPTLRAAPKRWPLVVLGLVVLAGGVSVALRRPAVTASPVEAPPSTTPPPVAPPAALAPPVPPPAPPVAPPAPARKAHVRVERHAATKPPVAPANAETSDAVKRGVLPSGSREAYPEK
jgi:hypothetical protein